MVANGTQSNFVTYFTNNTPDTVRRVMRRMCQIWADRFVSRVEMRICLKWEELDEGTLGATSTLVFIDGSRYSRLKNKVLYTPALGSALHGSDLIDPGGHHVIMVLNNLILWHLDLDETSRLDRFDLATTILHELTHGLFFTGAIQYTPTSTSTTSPSSSNTESSENSSSGQSASFRFGNAARFDQFIRVEGNISVAKSCNGDNIPKNGENLYNAIRSPNLQLVGRLRNRVFEMGLHAPRVYARGSSVYHFNNETIEEDCDRSGIPSGACSDLMTHELKQGYTNRDLGQTTLGVYDLMRSQQDGVKAGAPCVVQDYQPDDSGPGGSGEPGTFDLSTWGIIIISVVGAVGVILVVSVVVNTIVSRR